MGRDSGFDSAKLGFVRRKIDLVAERLSTHGLIGSCPDAPRSHIADVTKLTPVITTAVLAPATDRQLIAATVAAASTAYHHGIVAVRQKVGDGGSIGIKGPPIQLPSAAGDTGWVGFRLRQL